MSIHRHIPDAVYRSWSQLSQSGLIHKVTGTPPTGRNLLVGQVLHAAVFEGSDAMNLRYHVTDDDFKLNTKAGKARMLQTECETGKQVLRKSEFEQVRGMYHAVMEATESRELIDILQETELSVCGDLEKVPCKARIDGIIGHGLYDLKTTHCLSRAEFRDRFVKYRYHVQAAWYVDLFPQAEFFTHICVSSEKPHPCWVERAPPIVLEFGRQWYTDWLNYFKRKGELTDASTDAAANQETAA